MRAAVMRRASIADGLAVLTMTALEETTMTLQQDIDQAIEAEAQHWAKFFDVTDEAQIEKRRRVMRANVAVHFYQPLLPFMKEFFK
jgi:hypothetical protein